MAEKLCGLKKKGGGGGNNPFKGKIIKQTGYGTSGGVIGGAGTTTSNTQEAISNNSTNTFFSDTYSGAGLHTFTFSKPCLFVVSYNTANKTQVSGGNIPNITEFLEMKNGDTFAVYYHQFYWSIFE